MGAIERTAQVRLNHLVPVRRLQFVNDAEAADPGIVDQDIDAAEFDIDEAEKLLDLRPASYVARTTHHVSQRGEFLDSPCEYRWVAPADCNAGPLVQQGPGDRVTDAPAAPRNDRELTLDVDHMPRVASSVRAASIRYNSIACPTPIQRTACGRISAVLGKGRSRLFAETTPPI